MLLRIGISILRISKKIGNIIVGGFLTEDGQDFIVTEDGQDFFVTQDQ